MMSRTTSLLLMPWALMLLCGWGLGGASLAYAQEASVEVTVNSTTVKQGDMLRLTITFINCKIREIDPPQIPGLEWRMGPSTGNSTQWVNGVTTSEQRYTYGYVVTGAKEISIPAMSWSTNRGALKSKPIRLIVKDPEGAPNNSVKPQSKSVDRDLVTSIEPSKRTVYLGEPLVLTYKIYNRYNNLDVRNYDIPELEGFWKETIPNPEARWEPQLINGKRYNVATVRQIVAFPQQTGSLELKDFTLNGYLRINFFEGREIQATCDPVTIEVLPLPEAAPSQSLGTFAQLTVDQRLSTDSLDANDAVTLEVIFRGTGNLKFLREPQIAWPSEFEVFDPEVEDNIKLSAQGETGVRSFKYVAIPRAPGDYVLPALEATSFDPLTARHVTSTAPSVRLHVSRNAGTGGASNTMSFTHQQDVQVLNQDVRHILTSPSHFYPKARPSWTNWAFGLSIAGSPMAFLVLAWRRRKRMAEARDVRGTRQRKAFKSLRESLQKAAPTAEAVGEALEQYLMAKLELDRSQLTRESVRERLSTGAPELVKAWDELWVSCEMLRYAGSPGDAEALAARLLELAETTEAIWS